MLTVLSFLITLSSSFSSGNIFLIFVISVEGLIAFPSPFPDKYDKYTSFSAVENAL